MKVVILTKAKLFQPEAFVGVFSSKKAAEKYIRGISQYAKKDEMLDSWSIEHAGEVTLYFVNERDVRE